MSAVNGTLSPPIPDSLAVLATLDPATLPLGLASQITSLLANYQQLLGAASHIATLATQLATAQQQLVSSHQETLTAWNSVRTLPKLQPATLRGYAEAVRSVIDQLEDLALRTDGLATLTESVAP